MCNPTNLWIIFRNELMSIDKVHRIIMREDNDESEE